MVDTKDETLRQSVSATRRGFVAGVAGTAIAAPALLFPGKARAAERLVVVNWGGGVAAAKKAAYYDPFTAETGIPVVSVAGPELAKIKVQVQSKDVEWDLVDLVDSWVTAGEELGLYEKIDTSIVPMDRLLPAARRDHEFATHFYAGVICHSETRVPEPRRPKTWADYWNVEKFPGRRGLRNRIGETLEIALLADGVPPDQVYPCDVERAFKALDRVKPHITQWVAQTPQTSLLVQAGELDLSYTYLSRVYEGRKAGVPLGFSPENNLIGGQWMAAITGTKNKAAAMRFMEFFTRPDRQEAYCNITGHAPAVKGVLEKLRPEIRPWVPDPLGKTNLILNTDWWAGKEEMLTKRFKEWLLT